MSHLLERIIDGHIVHLFYQPLPRQVEVFRVCHVYIYPAHIIPLSLYIACTSTNMQAIRFPTFS